MSQTYHSFSELAKAIKPQRKAATPKATAAIGQETPKVFKPTKGEEYLPKAATFIAWCRQNGVTPL
jgi:hypothetical protein